MPNMIFPHLLIPHVENLKICSMNRLINYFWVSGIMLIIEIWDWSYWNYPSRRTNYDVMEPTILSIWWVSFHEEKISRITESLWMVSSPTPSVFLNRKMTLKIANTAWNWKRDKFLVLKNIIYANFIHHQVDLYEG